MPTTHTVPLLEQARARLVAIDAETARLAEEAAVLRRMIAAGEGVGAQPAPSAAPPLPAPFWPWPANVPTLPHPLTPWVVGPDHGGMCACPHCCRVIYCGPTGDVGNGVDIRVRPDGAAMLLRHDETPLNCAVYAYDPARDANGVRCLS